MADQGCGIPARSEIASASGQPRRLGPAAMPSRRATPPREGGPGNLGYLVLRLWRHLGPRSMDIEIREALRYTLAATEVTSSSDWGATLRSAADPDGPIHPSVDFLHRGNVDSRTGDELMSALALRGLGGDCAASTVVANALAILAYGHLDADRLAELSSEWSSLASLQRVASGTERT